MLCLALPQRQFLHTSLSIDMILEKQCNKFSIEHAYSQVIQGFPELHEHVHGVQRLALHLLLSMVMSITHAY